MDVPEARNILAKFGWKPPAPDASWEGEGDDLQAAALEMRKKGWSEVQDCAPTGNATCNLLYLHKSGAKLTIGYNGEVSTDSPYVDCGH